jgi:signal transduction histidine kinase
LLNAVIADVRAYVMELPRDRDGEPMAAQLGRVAADVGGAGNTTITVEVHEELPHLSEEQMHAIVQVAREALSNTVRHAAASAARLSLAREASGVLLEVQDDGRGFDPQVSAGQDHMGLRNMRARADQLGAEFEVESAPGAGTAVRMLIRL